MKKNRKKAIIAEILLVSVIAVIVIFVIVKTSSTGEPDETANGETGAVADETTTVDKAPEAEQTAIYTVKYDVSWSAETHPVTLPEGAHVSPIFIISHKSEDDLFAASAAAAEGIEIMAETGATDVLATEVGNNPSILNSTVGSLINVPGSGELEIELNQNHPLLSAVSMLAPSPDWFVAVSNVKLFKDGQWLEEVELEVRPYDAGTDSGTTFTAVDLDTDPTGVIGPPIDDLFIDAAAENVFATITLIRKSPD